MQEFDVIIIGSGPSGLMCASNIKNKNVLVLEKMGEIGGKIKVSGGGRCNVTNKKPIDQILQNIPGNSKFLFPAFNNMKPCDIINFFETNGCKLKEEDNNRIFPKSDNSQSIINTFKKILRENNVIIENNFTVNKINKKDHNFIINDSYITKILVIATGGKTYHHLGTSGDGYELLKNFGHTTTELFPTETPLVSHDLIIQNKIFQGISLSNVKVDLLINNKPKKTITNDLLFTHFGLSGPLALLMSYYVTMGLKNKKTVAIKIHLNSIELPKKLKEAYTGEDYLIINIHSTKGWGVAFVTAGGISLKEINPNSFESKLKKNLFVIGELLDINAHTGGYNITACFAQGYSVATYINTLN
ncbi:MAG: NAD(P)/FAD-dependent oxidoreductase [Mycoplasmatales bacterium]